MQSLALGDGLVESLALGSGDLELQSARLAGTVGTLCSGSEMRVSERMFASTYSEGTGTPGGSTVNLVKVGELGEGGLVT